MATEFKDYRKTEEITLPVSGAKVEVYDGLMTEDIQVFQGQGENIDIKDAMSRLIASWDFERDGTPVEVNPENVGKLHMRDFHAIQNAANLTDFLGEDERPSPTGN